MASDPPSAATKYLVFFFESNKKKKKKRKKRAIDSSHTLNAIPSGPHLFTFSISHQVDLGPPPPPPPSSSFFFTEFCFQQDERQKGNHKTKNSPASSSSSSSSSSFFPDDRKPNTRVNLPQKKSTAKSPLPICTCQSRSLFFYKNSTSFFCTPVAKRRAVSLCFVGVDAVFFYQVLTSLTVSFFSQFRIFALFSKWKMIVGQCNLYAT